MSASDQFNVRGSDRPIWAAALLRHHRPRLARYHYLPPSEFAEAEPQLVQAASIATSKAGPRVIVGSTWTTDEPFRETAEAIEAAKRKGILGVEMEAAALYAFARSADVRALCLAHVTNTMGQDGADFEKGEADGTRDALAVLSGVIEALYPGNQLRGTTGDSPFKIRSM